MATRRGGGGRGSTNTAIERPPFVGRRPTTTRTGTAVGEPSRRAGWEEAVLQAFPPEAVLPSFARLGVARASSDGGRWAVAAAASFTSIVKRAEAPPPPQQGRQGYHHARPPRRVTAQGCKAARMRRHPRGIAAADRVVSVDRLSRPETRPAFAAVCISVPQQCHVTQPDLESSRPQPIDRRYRGLPDASSKQPPGHQRYADADADADPSLRVVACSGRSAGPNSSEEPTRWDTSAITPATPESRKPLLQVLTKLTPHENIYTVPNLLTFSRLTAAPVVGYLVLHDHHAWAVGLFAYAGITDLVDGYIARRWNLQTVVGTVIDPMADKTLMTILTVCLAIKGALPVWLAVIILGRDAGLAVTAIYYRWISLPPPKTFARYWDFSLPSAEVHPTTISKYNTALQLALIGATTAMPLVTVDVSVAMTAMQYLVATTTVWSGASYIYSKDAVKILNQGRSNNVPAGEAPLEKKRDL
ncbi:cardiolipin synthase [Marssonina coronariae]|uniref:Cardiolipin synthase n=1 Tax=Diplocarpon coronariae TaxID=2795749 RepID=A0A218YYH3_9HELO|nr:cardiolipin synthase [Marssonina coronariae]